MLLFVGTDGEPHVLVEEETADLGDPTPSPDGRYLAFANTTWDSNAWMIENF